MFRVNAPPANVGVTTAKERLFPHNFNSAPINNRSTVLTDFDISPMYRDTAAARVERATRESEINFRRKFARHFFVRAAIINQNTDP